MVAKERLLQTDVDRRLQFLIPFSHLLNMMHWLIIVAILVYFLVSVLKKLIYRSSRDNYKWLRRETRLLNALHRDYRRIKESVKEFNEKTNLAWDLIPGSARIILPVDESQRRWLEEAKSMAVKAETMVRLYKTPSSSFSSFANLLQALRLARGMNKAKRQISNHLSGENRFLRKICESLQDSGDNVRCLMDRPIDHDSVSTRPSFHSEVASYELVDRELCSCEWARLLRQAFLEDLLNVWLESELENAWLTEAQRLVEERNDATLSLSEILVDQPSAGFFDLLHLFGIWVSKRRATMEEIDHADSMLSDLINAKERYGFKLNGRESSKPSIPEQSGFSLVASSAKERVNRLLGQMQGTLNARVREEVEGLFDRLENAQTLLKDMQVSTEGAHDTRAVCFEQLKRLSTRAEISSLRIMESGPYSRVSSAFPYLSREYLKFRSQINVVKEGAGLLEKSASEYRINMVKDPSSVVGAEQDIHTLVSKLFNGGDQRGFVVVCCITGMKGIGKTTLVKEIFNHTSVINHFEDRRLLTLSQENNGNISSGVERVKQYVETWKVSSERMKCLLVLDNLFSKEAWDELKQELDVGTSDLLIKVVITTRNIEVAAHVNRENIHQLRLRTKEESWDLFTQMVPMTCKIVETQPTEGEEETEMRKKEALVRKIVRRAGGLPLSILHIGYLLAAKKLEDVKLEVLLRVLEHVTQGQNQTPWRDLWEMNKEDFKSKPILTNRLSSFEIIPFNYEIPARRVVALWVALGLVESEDAHDCLSKLINRNMIQVVERRLNGKVKTCRFPAALREIWLQRPRDDGPIRAWSLTTSQDGQLAYHFDDNDANHNYRINGLRANLPNFIHEVKHPRSIMFFDTREGRQPGHDIGKFLQEGIKSGRFRDLLVLDLEGIFRPNLPKNIGKLKQLTYLGLRWTHLEKIPASVGELTNLQTLDMKYTYIRTLPVSVWKLKKLRHLYLNEQCRITLMPKPSLMPLQNLQTLTGAFLDEDSPLKDGLEKLSNLRKLGLVFQLSIDEQEGLGKSIEKLTKLTSLSLSSVNEKIEPQSLKLEDFSCLESLSVLYLFGQLTTPSTITQNQLPASLTELILSATGLETDPMPVLGQLPNLKSLSFLAHSYNGKALVCSNNKFLQLLDLKLWNLPNLESLKVNTRAMQNLREMEIRSCKSFLVFEGLTHLKTLQELKLTSMPNKFVRYVQNEFAVAMNQSRIKIHCPKIKVEFPLN